MKKFLVFMMALVMSAVVFAHAALVSIDDIGGGKFILKVDSQMDQVLEEWNLL